VRLLLPLSLASAYPTESVTSERSSEHPERVQTEMRSTPEGSFPCAFLRVIISVNVIVVAAPRESLCGSNRQARATHALLRPYPRLPWLHAKQCHILSRFHDERNISPGV
jgi:hypothetical protein